MLQSSGLANTPCWACHFEGPPPKHPNDPPGTGFQEAETKGPKTLAAIDVPFSESGRSRITPPTRPISPIRGLSYTFRKSPVARDCVVGPRGFEPPTRPLYPDVGGAYASHRLPIIARYFLERQTIGIGLRHVRRLRPRSGTDFVEQLADKTERVNLIVVPTGRETQQLGPQVRLGAHRGRAWPCGRAWIAHARPCRRGSRTARGPGGRVVRDLFKEASERTKGLARRFFQALAEDGDREKIRENAKPNGGVPQSRFATLRRRRCVRVACEHRRDQNATAPTPINSVMQNKSLAYIHYFNQINLLVTVRQASWIFPNQCISCTEPLT
jgi:hypothetical protein